MQGVLVAPLAMLGLLQFFLRLFLVHARDVIAALALSALQPHYIGHLEITPLSR
jgi:hypothetical protein